MDNSQKRGRERRMTDNLLNADYLIGHASMSHKVIDINIWKTFHLEIGISAEGTILKYIFWRTLFTMWHLWPSRERKRFSGVASRYICKSKHVV